MKAHTPKRSLGQNFLVSEHVIQRMIQSARRLGERAPLWIEIGPGRGALTDHLQAIAPKLQLIELDRALAQEWRERGLQILEADALQVDWKSLEIPAGSFLISNLPYQIGSRLLIDRSVQPAGIENMLLMFQKEVAQRIAAEPQTPDYSLLSVLAQTFWRISSVVDAAPSDFRPRPQIASRVLSFSRYPDDELNGLQDENLALKYLAFCRAGFAQRRKLLSRNLGLQKIPGWEEAFQALGIEEKARAEELSIKQWVSLFCWLEGNKHGK